MRVVITGICGHLGSAFARYLLATQPGIEIVGIDDLSCGYPSECERLQFRMASSCDARPFSIYPLSLGHDHTPWLSKLFEGADYVFHFAAYAAEGLSPFIRRYDTANNLGGTIDVLNACLNVGTVKRIVFTSSMAVYGHGHPPFAESAPRRPIDPYGVSKSAAEQHLEIAADQHGQDFCIIRPHNLYGPGQSIWQKYRNVLGNWMARRLQGLPLLVYGDGTQRRAFSYIDDCLPSLWRSATLPDASGEIVNLGGRTPRTIQQAAEALVAIAGGTIEHVEPRHEVREAYCTTAKSVALLGYEDRTPFDVGLLEMWKWAQFAWAAHPERRGTHNVTQPEVRRGLYSFWRDSA